MPQTQTQQLCNRGTQQPGINLQNSALRTQHSGLSTPDSTLRTPHLMDIGDDPRFHAGVAAMNAHDYFDASEIFEDLFFEAVRDEVLFARLFLQVAVGAHHPERGQRGAAIDRLVEGLKALDVITNDRGWDLARLGHDLRRLSANVRAAGPWSWPEVGREA